MLGFMATKSEVGMILEGARVAQGLTVVEAAERAGLKRQQWAAVCGAARPRVGTVVRCALAVGCTAQQFARVRPDVAMEMMVRTDPGEAQKLRDDLRGRAEALRRSPTSDALREHMTYLLSVFPPAAVFSALNASTAYRPRQHRTVSTPPPRKVS